MTERSKSKSRLFFIEILIIIVFFSICAGVCMNLFAKAKLISAESSDLTKGVLEAQTAAEAIKAKGNSPELEELLGAFWEDDALKVYYDGEWNKVSPEEAPVYEMAIYFTQEQGLLTAKIQVLKGGREFHSLETKTVRP